MWKDSIYFFIQQHLFLFSLCFIILGSKTKPSCLYFFFFFLAFNFCWFCISIFLYSFDKFSLGICYVLIYWSGLSMSWPPRSYPLKPWISQSRTTRLCSPPVRKNLELSSLICLSLTWPRQQQNGEWPNYYLIYGLNLLLNCYTNTHKHIHVYTINYKQG